MVSTNPFDDDNGSGVVRVLENPNYTPTSVPPSRPHRTRLDNQPEKDHDGGGGQHVEEEQPIWTARSVDWPIPSHLTSGGFARLNRESRKLGSNLGISSDSGGSGGGILSDDGRGVGGDEDGDGGADGVKGGGYYGLGGLMGRVLGGQSGSGSHAAESQTDEDDPTASRPVRPPRARCVASSNGWIVAAVECSLPPPSSSPSSLNTSTPPLRLVSRWNVRRGGGSPASASSGEHLMPIPPPVRVERSSLGGKNRPFASRIAHVFVDPTGCHTLLSARNGELYYLHSSARQVRKLPGFGPNPDGTPGCSAGLAASDEATGRVQKGLTPGSFISAVAWDGARGTEGSTKRILLGSSIGEVYEHALVGPNIDGNTVDDSGDNGVMQAYCYDENVMPILLHRLNAREANRLGVGENSGEAAAVSGLYFERGSDAVNGRIASVSIDEGPNGIEKYDDVLILAATSGPNKPTRLHTYRCTVEVSFPSDTSAVTSSEIFSVGQSSFRRVFTQGRGSFVELPGSVSFADFHICRDGFAMQTGTGIYYGSVDRTGKIVAGATVVGASVGGSGSGNGLIDAGILPYDVGRTPPSSVALTPHHFITLSEAKTSEVHFLSRVAMKVVQKENIDWSSKATALSATPGGAVERMLVEGGPGELITDIRRPDQIWLRKARSLVHISSSCEDRDVWMFTLETCLEQRKLAPSRSMAATLSLTQRQSGSSASATMIPSVSPEERMQDASFERAKILCANSEQRAVVAAARAEFHLAYGRVELAARHMAQCPPSLMPFSDTCSRLALPALGVDDSRGYGNSALAREGLASGNMALITYLTDKMRQAKSRGDDVSCTMMGAWLAELHLHERERGAVATVIAVNGKSQQTAKLGAPASTSNNALLHQFLSSNVNNMDAKAILKILGSHDITAVECASYAAASGEIGAAVNAALCADNGKNGALDALRVLNESPIEQAEPYYYKHASTLLSRAPTASAKSFLSRYSEGLSATKLLPAFMHYERRREEVKRAVEIRAEGGNDLTSHASVKDIQIEKSRAYVDGVEVHIKVGELSQCSSFVNDESASIKYLDGVTQFGCQSTAVYNYLISLYASMNDEGPLFRFLKTHIPATPKAAQNVAALASLSIGVVLLAGDNSPLDMSYALRVILRTGRHFRSAVRLYMGFGMRRQATELAIKVDPALARKLAHESTDPDERRGLWLMIARNAASDGEDRGGKDVVAKVVSVLNDCGPDVLSIEDVLPFLPDFAQIDQFKDEICGALTSYSSKIERYLKEMNECDQTCDTLREEISCLSTHNSNMKSNARCAYTKRLIITEDEPFYVFPSGYVFLESALRKEVLPFLNEKQQLRVESIEQELSQLKSQIKESSEAYVEQNVFFEDLQTEFDGLIAAECPLTGTMMVDSIDHGFAASMEEDRLYESSGHLFEAPMMNAGI